MHHTKSHLTKRLAAIALLLLASAALVACGGSSSTTGSTTTATTNASATAPAGGANRFSALRECLKKEGITLPTRSKGSRPKGGPGGAFLGGGGARTLPNGVSRSKFEAAMKKCGGAGFNRFGGRGRANSASFKKSLEKFATCMRENGIDVPAPNTSGSGPIFNTKGIDTASSKFRTAQQKCASLLSYARPGGAAGAPGGPGGAGGAEPAPAG